MNYLKALEILNSVTYGYLYLYKACAMLNCKIKVNLGFFESFGDIELCDLWLFVLILSLRNDVM